MDLRILTKKDEGVLERFASEHPCGGVEQSWAFGELQATVPGRGAFYVFGLFDGSVLKGSMLVVRQNMGMGKTWLWCPGGPLLPESGEGWGLLQKAAERLAKAAGDVFLRIESRVDQARGARFGGHPVLASYIPRDSLLVDLSQGEESVLKQMTQKGRYNIKQAEKNGVLVRQAGEEGLDAFYKLLRETANRDGFFVHKVAFYRDFLRKLGKQVQFYVAMQQNEMVAGALVVHFGSTATYYFGASSVRLGDSKAPYLVQWFAMKAAKRAGMKTYDFLGIAPEGSAEHPLQGVTQFKTRFGGKRVSYAKAEVFVYRPFWWAAYRLAKWLKFST